MLSLMLYDIYAQCHSQALFAECRYAECHYAECRYAEWRYAECRSAYTMPYFGFKTMK
jgi:hypothetical protein